MSRQRETPRGAHRTVPSSSGKRNTVLIATLTERGNYGSRATYDVAMSCRGSPAALSCGSYAAAAGQQRTLALSVHHGLCILTATIRVKRLLALHGQLHGAHARAAAILEDGMAWPIRNVASSMLGE